IAEGRPMDPPDPMRSSIAAGPALTVPVAAPVGVGVRGISRRTPGRRSDDAIESSRSPRHPASVRDDRRRVPSQLGGDALKIVLLAAAYYGTAILSLRLALVRGQVTPIWPPTGIALVALLVFGRRLW